MKLKEIPISLFKSVWLRASANRLQQQSLSPNSSFPVIVSLTSYGHRLQSVDLSVLSILNQSVIPKKIILWLHKEDMPLVPNRLAKLQNNVFELRETKLSKSHSKLIPALNAFPNLPIITIDDDLLYPKHFLAKFIQVHKSHPEAIVANQYRIIQKNENNSWKAYEDWPMNAPVNNGKFVLPLGFGGVLYPPNSLHEEVFNLEQMLALTPHADDLWFKTMALKQSTTVIANEEASRNLLPIWGSQKTSLKQINISENRNNQQWEALCEHYNLNKLLV